MWNITDKKNTFSFCLCIMFLVPMSAFADITDSSLDPDKRKEVREIGATILQAKRTYQADENVEKIKQQLTLTRQALDELIRPLPVQTLSLQNAASTGQITSQVAAAQTTQSWQSSRANQINTLNIQMKKLSRQCQSMKQKMQLPEPGFFESVQNYFLGNTVQKTKNDVVLDISPSVLNRLENLDKEIEEIMAMTDMERHQKLQALSKDLKLQKHKLQLPKSEKQTPTYITRTTHR